jgi:sulfatase maturation enzyme AslB (radical SAM superfamily)
MSNALSFRIPGNSNTLTFNPCCLYDEYLPFHPTVFKKERKKFIEATDFLPGCSKCKLKEKTHETSHRLMFNKKIPDNIGESIWKLEIVLDTTCNAACIQCGPLQSSLWRQQIAEIKNEHIIPKEQIDDRIEKIKDTIDLNNVKHFHFWGGEPLATDTHIKFLEEVKDPSDVVVSYTTNGSIFPDTRVLETWSKFKNIRIGISIDGTEDRFFYIRWPLSWSKVSNNLIRFKNETAKNTHFHINYCAIPLNLLYINESINRIREIFPINHDGTDIKCTFIKGEGTLDIAYTPESLRKKVWEQLGNDHDVSNLLKETPIFNPSDMIKHLEKWDKVRKLNWRETFSEVSPHFKY